MEVRQGSEGVENKVRNWVFTPLCQRLK